MKRRNDFKRYLDPSIISKIKTLDLKARYVVEGFMVGIHQSPYHGFSVEFSEHRAYNQGDPIRNIDWKVYARKEKFFIKQYEEETNLFAHILLDSSNSMSFRKAGAISKFEYGKILAAAISYLLINQQDSVGFALYSDRIEAYLKPKSNRVYLKEILVKINNSKPQNKTATSESLKTIAQAIKKRGLIVIISDFFDDYNSVISALKHFHYKKNEIILFQILDPFEINFAFEQDSIFVDLETGDELATQPRLIQKSYLEELNEFLKKFRKECRNYGIDYNLISTATPFDKALLSFFNKRKKMG